MGTTLSNAFQSEPKTDWKALEDELVKVMDQPNHDDGTLGPLFIRLAWHSSGTYCAKSKTGGSCGATMRFPKESNDPENKGLDKARIFLEPVKKKFPNVSYSDLWVFAAYVFIEKSGGPALISQFVPGRVDKGEDEAVAPGRLPGAETGFDKEGAGVDDEERIPGWEKNAQHIRDVFYRMGLNDKDIVALLCGGHVYGRCHTENSGYAGAWVEEPWAFSNEYAADMIEDDWKMVKNDTKIPKDPVHQNGVHEEVRPAKGFRQYIGVMELTDDVPDPSKWKPGQYEIISAGWANAREGLDFKSPIVAQPKTGEILNIVLADVFKTSVRGMTDTGAWISFSSKYGEDLFKRVGDLKFMPGAYRKVNDSIQISGSQPDFKEAEFTVDEIVTEGESIYGVINSMGGARVKLFAPNMTRFGYELIKTGWNDKPRDRIEDQPRANQMMLPSDMVLVWDPEFKKHLEVYAEDEDKLREDFGVAFKQLTELGFKKFPAATECPWKAATAPATEAASADAQPELMTPEVDL